MADKTYRLVFGMTSGATKSVEFTAPQGPKGDTGATGAQGPQGAKGETGATGAKGDKGERGLYYIPEVDGVGNLTFTPSEVTVDGTTVPVPDAVNIKGPKGDTGATGATGAKGDTGATGAKGDTGIGIDSIEIVEV